MDDEQRWRAVQGRDPRFDGWFVLGVTTTGIYCRPSCPARTPRREVVRFHPGPAAAQAAGLRACKRCRPDATPGSPEWDGRSDLAARAVRLLADGVVDREGVAGLATRLGYSARQVERALVAELGAGPLALARAQRAQTARVLLETTDLPLGDVAFAAGFGSVRQFNDTVREVFARTPGRSRAALAAPGPPRRPGEVALRLPFRAPLHADQLFGHLAATAVPGRRGVARRRLPPHAAAAARAAAPSRWPRRPAPGPAWVACRLRLTDLRDLAPAVARCRRLLDLDADPVAVDAALAEDDVLAPLVARGARPAGARAPSTATSSPCGPCSASRSAPPPPAPTPPGWSQAVGEPVDDPGRRPDPPVPDRRPRSPTSPDEVLALPRTRRRHPARPGPGAGRRHGRPRPGRRPGRRPRRPARAARHRPLDRRAPSRCGPSATPTPSCPSDLGVRVAARVLGLGEGARPARARRPLGAVPRLRRPAPVGHRRARRQPAARPRARGDPMRTHAIVDSPLGPLTVVGDGRRPRRPAPGRPAPPARRRTGSATGTTPTLPGLREQLDGLLRRRAARLRRPARRRPARRSRPRCGGRSASAVRPDLDVRRPRRRPRPPTAARARSAPRSAATRSASSCPATASSAPAVP